MKPSPGPWLQLIVFLTLPLILGCGRPGAAVGAAEMTIPELGLSLNLPPGWRVERGEPRMMVEVNDPDSRFGLVEDYPAEGQSLEQVVEELIRLDADVVTSRQALTIGGYPAVLLISEAEFALAEAVILKDDRVIRVSFRVEREAFPVQGPALRKALASLRLH